MRQKQLAIAILVFIGASVQAQAPVYDPKQLPTYDAGALARQAEQFFKQSQIQRNQQKRDALPPVMVLTEATLVTVQQFKFSGNKLLTDEQLQSVTASFLNQPLKQQDLQHLTHAVTEAYRQTGWLVRAYIPRQDLTNVELTVQVIESIPPSKPGQ
jgi:hemolysin activation/secretion protein